MKVNQYLKLALRNKLFIERRWIIMAFTIPFGESKSKLSYDLSFDGKTLYFLDDEGVREDIDTEEDKPLLSAYMPITLDVGDLANVTEVTETYVGNALFNAISFAWAFGDIIPYQNYVEFARGKDLDAVLEPALRNDVITVEQYKNFTLGMGHLTVFAPFIIPCGSPKLLEGSPEAKARLNELLEEYKDQLDDPAIVAMITDEVIKLDKDFMKNDPGAKFLLKGKAYGTVRMKSKYMQGGVAKLDDPSKVHTITTSLQEGYQIEDMPAIVNGLRSGSILRGSETALGGYKAKQLSRSFQNISITIDDCGTKVGIPVYIDGLTVDKYIGFYKPGNVKPLTASDLESSMGKTLLIRDPNVCNVPDGNYCKHCMGDIVANSGIGLITQGSGVGNRFMSISLAAFHVSQLEVQEYDITARIR